MDTKIALKAILQKHCSERLKFFLNRRIVFKRNIFPNEIFSSLGIIYKMLLSQTNLTKHLITDKQPWRKSHLDGIRNKNKFAISQFYNMQYNKNFNIFNNYYEINTLVLYSASRICISSPQTFQIKTLKAFHRYLRNCITMTLMWYYSWKKW